jgi:branched-chain amino acid transport system permease protein
MLRSKKLAGVLLLATLAFLMLLPHFVSGYEVRVITNIFMYAAMAQGINLMLGYMGYVPFGNAMFFGIGAYVTAIGMNKGLSFFLAAPLAALVAILLTMVFGLLLLRLRGHYFAIATIGLSAALLGIVQDSTITGGAMGITLPLLALSPSVTNTLFYFGMLALMVCITFVLYLVVKSRLGFGIRSIKANEEAAVSMGINTTYYKIVTWAISALFTSLVGALYAYWMSFVAPNEVFDIMIVVNCIVIVLLGGVGTLLGPIAGAFVYEFVGQSVWSALPNYHLCALGILIIVILLFVPKGIFGGISDFVKWRQMKLAKKAGV